MNFIPFCESNFFIFLPAENKTHNMGNLKYAEFDSRYEEHDIDYVIYGLLMVEANTYVLLTLIVLRGFQNPLGTIAKALTLTDIVIGLVFLIDGMGLSFEWNPSLSICNTMSFILNVAFGMNIVLFGCISYDRYTAIVHPEIYSKCTTKKGVHMTIASLLCVCCIIFLPSLYGWGVDKSSLSRSCIANWQNFSSNSFFFISCLIVINLLISSFCYFKMLESYMEYFDISEHKKPNKYTMTDPSKWDAQTAKVYLGIIILYYMIWLPYMILTFIK